MWIIWGFFSVACGFFVNDRAQAYNVRHPFNPMTRPSLHVLQPTSHGSNPRFVQAKSKLDLMVFITNVFFPRQEPPEYKLKFQRGGCPRWLLDPRKGTPELTKDWLPATGWAYDLPNQIIEYRGSEEAKEPAHAFPFNLFLPRRASTRFALIKRDFFCQGTQIQSTIMLNGAKEAGLVFRGVGERNFWAVMLTLGRGINLLRVKNGEKQNLGSIGDFFVQGGQWYTVNVQELIGDVRVTVGEIKVETRDSTRLSETMVSVLEGKEPVKFSRQQEKEEEVRPKNYEDSQGAAGLIAGGGPAKFKGTFVDTSSCQISRTPQFEIPQASRKMKAVTSALGRDLAAILELPDHLKNWCPEGSLCAGPLFTSESAF